MKNMTLTQIAAACNGQLIGDTDHNNEKWQAPSLMLDKMNCQDNSLVMNHLVAGVVIDSRKVEKDYLFIATVGERVDGHNFINEVYEKGALAVVCEKVPADPKGPYILVQNSFDALKRIATWYRMQLSIKVIGITGSVGKTSTKEFISSVLSQKYNVLKTEGNFNNEIGLPLTILRIREEHEVAVLEMGISNFGEMHRLSEIAKPDICVITNIGQCHLENLGTRQGILQAKSEIFDFMNPEGFVCVNGDDDILATIKQVHGRDPIRFGLGSDNEVSATDVIAKGLFGSSCTIHVNNNTFSAEVPLPGSHMVLNALAATAVANLLSMNCGEIADGIKSVQPVGGRSNIIRQDKLTIIDDCYNANPVSMKAAIDLLSMADTRKVALLGDMGELGNSEKALHYEIGAYAAAAGINLLVCVGELSSNMYEGASQQIAKNVTQSGNSLNTELLYYKTREELIEAIPSFLSENDTILVKASHFMGFENVVKALSQAE